LRSQGRRSFLNELLGDLLYAGREVIIVKELATDLAIVIGPAGIVYYLIGDPWVSALWVFVGVTVRWYQRRWQQPPYRKGDEGGGKVQ
jgi:hypothetical protein